MIKRRLTARERIEPFFDLLDIRYLPLLVLALPQSLTVAWWSYLSSTQIGMSIYMAIPQAIFSALAFEMSYVGAIAWAERVVSKGVGAFWLWATAGSALAISIGIALRTFDIEQNWRVLHAGFSLVGFCYTIYMHLNSQVSQKSDELSNSYTPLNLWSQEWITQLKNVLIGSPVCDGWVGDICFEQKRLGFIRRRLYIQIASGKYVDIYLAGKKESREAAFILRAKKAIWQALIAGGTLDFPTARRKGKVEVLGKVDHGNRKPNLQTLAKIEHVTITGLTEVIKAIQAISENTQEPLTKEENRYDEITQLIIAQAQSLKEITQEIDGLSNAIVQERAAANISVEEITHAISQIVTRQMMGQLREELVQSIITQIEDRKKGSIQKAHKDTAKNKELFTQPNLRVIGESDKEAPRQLEERVSEGKMSLADVIAILRPRYIETLNIGQKALANELGTSEYRIKQAREMLEQEFQATATSGIRD